MQMIIERYKDKRRERQKRVISTIYLEFPSGRVTCFTQQRKIIDPFCGTLTKSLWEQMKPFIHNTPLGTRIRIYDYALNKSICNHALINPYLENESLLRLKP